ncbi:MAG: tRNA (adenosine(37)-N6)-threonylcarbamoyltransferase complex ATPase subunit type 1 TsaE [Pseudomonadota bacterium]
MTDSAEPAPQIWTVPLPDAAATDALGARLASALAPGDAVFLIGPLGAGKTTLARGLIRAACSDFEVEVPSPTFALIQQYDAPNLLISHLDLYRLEKPDEVLEIGYEEALDQGACLIEWPDRLGPYAPADRLEVALEAAPRGGTERVGRVTGYGAWAERAQRLNLNTR